MNCCKLTDWDKACLRAPPAAATLYTTNTNLPLALPILSRKSTHENKCLSPRRSPSLHSLGGVFGGGRAAYRWSLGLCVYPLSATPTHHRSHPPFHQVQSTMMLCLLEQGVCFGIHVGSSPQTGTLWLGNHDNQKPNFASVGHVTVVSNLSGLGFFKESSDLLLLCSSCRWSPRHEAGSTISVPQEMLTRG